MKSIVSAALIVTLTAPSVGAQQLFDGAQSSSPDKRPVETAEAASASRNPARDRDADWADVGEIAPGQEILVAVHGAPVTQRRLLAADDASLTVLDVSEARIPNRVRSVLIDRLGSPRSFRARGARWDGAARQGYGSPAHIRGRSTHGA